MTRAGGAHRQLRLHRGHTHLVVKAIKQYGLTDFYGVISKPHAGRVCGVCYGTVPLLLNEFLAEDSNKIYAIMMFVEDF